MRGPEIVCVLGPSGCGKTTLLNVIAGFLRPTAGRVHIHGHPVLAPNPKVGYVFQHPSLFPWLDVHQNVVFGPRLHGVPPQTRNQRCDALLEKVGLPHAAKSLPHELSGGMQQRVALARVLINDPEVLLMDEPFGALDALTRVRMQQLMVDLWEDSPLPIIFVTHSVEESIRLADRILLMAPSPQGIIADHTISLPRPRDLSHPDLVHLNQLLYGQLLSF